MAFKDLAEFQDPDLHLPYNGTVYTVKAADIDLGLYLHQVFTIGLKASQGGSPDAEDAAKLDDGDERAFTLRCLGQDLYETLKTDGVPFRVVSLMAQTLLFDTCVDRETAEQFWASGGKAQGPNRATRRTATRTRTAAATTTPPPASASGTSTPKGTTPPRTRGKKS